jgi:hypothetical protein
MSLPAAQPTAQARVECKEKDNETPYATAFSKFGASLHSRFGASPAWRDDERRTGRENRSVYK